jgi:hypothetical protein
MLGEILTIINTGLSVINGVTTLIRNMEDASLPESSSRSVQTAQRRIRYVQKEIDKPLQNEASLLKAYSALLLFLQNDKYYSSKIEITPTKYGTWRIKRKRIHKNTILRDPSGEYHNR